MASRVIKVNDRVKRITGLGCSGLVKEIRTEATVARVEPSEKANMVNVLWDNGTLSYLSPEALEIDESK
jgi:hypothetical protein